LDLKLMFDEDDFSLRIVDDNVKGITKKEQGIHTFNKLLTSTADGTNTLGPEVLSIKVDTDYPKMLYAQLAISGLGNYSSQPDTRDLYHSQYSDKGLSNRLNSLLNEKNMQPSGLPPQYAVGEQNNVAATIKVYIKSAVNPYQGNLSGVAEQLSVAFGGLPGTGGQASENIPVEIRTILTRLVSTTKLNVIR